MAIFFIITPFYIRTCPCFIYANIFYSAMLFHKNCLKYSRQTYFKYLALLFLWLVSLGINPHSKCWWAVFWDYIYSCVLEFWFTSSFWIFSFCFLILFLFPSFSVFFLPHCKVLQLSLSKPSGPLCPLMGSCPLWCW